MNKPIPPRKPPPAKPLDAAENKPKPRPRTVAKKTTAKTGQGAGKPAVKMSIARLKYQLLLWVLEVLGLMITAVAAMMVLLGYSATWFAGTRFFTSLLPFAIGVSSMVVLASCLLLLWWKLRKWLQGRALFAVPLVSVMLALVVGWFSLQDQFAGAREHFRVLVGGKQEAERVTLAHQVYAAYRRLDVVQSRRMLARAEPYHGVIGAAARAFELDVNLLEGIAAVESSFLPRDSKDGGQGLFQITRVPKAMVAEAGKQLGLQSLSLAIPKHNAFIAAATLKYYLAEMQGDLFLALLAYNIGPTNGGLKFIMQQYGATDFVTIQPYLQALPRDYPIRVLSYALVFRVWQSEAKLLAYEEGKNALHIQQIGIPGLNADFYDFP